MSLYSNSESENKFSKFKIQSLISTIVAYKK